MFWSQSVRIPSPSIQQNNALFKPSNSVIWLARDFPSKLRFQWQPGLYKQGCPCFPGGLQPSKLLHHTAAQKHNILPIVFSSNIMPQSDDIHITFSR